MWQIFFSTFSGNWWAAHDALPRPCCVFNKVEVVCKKESGGVGFLLGPHLIPELLLKGGGTRRDRAGGQEIEAATGPSTALVFVT